MDSTNSDQGTEQAADFRFFFVIPLRPRADEGKWATTIENLGGTLRSLLSQTDPDFQIIIAGHDLPALAEMSDPRLTFLTVDILRPTAVGEGQPDAVRKRQIAAAEAGRRGGGYIMNVDADDLVHKDVVSFVRGDRHPVGYMVRAGYVLDHANMLLGHFPDAKRVPQLWANCGTCAIFRLAPSDLPKLLNHKTDIRMSGRQSLYQKLKGHRRWESKMMMAGRYLSTVPFRAVVYMMNTGANLSYDKRTGDLIDELLRSTRENPLDVAMLRDFAV